MIANNSRKVDPSGVVRLSDVKVRRRRDTLLMSWRGFAKSAAEHRSHGLDDAAAVWSLQLAVEQTIEDEFPLVYAEQFGLWAVEERSYEHPRGVLTPGCGRCRRSAASGDPWTP